MNFVRWQFLWRVLGSLGLLLAALLPLFSGPQAALAASGTNISNMGKTTGQALGIDPAGTSVCTVWSQYDVGSPRVYFRLYDTASRAWSPPLGTAATSFSNGGAAGQMRCTVDANGNAHVVWNEGGKIYHRYRSANGTWSNIVRIADGSHPDIDADGSGKVWVVIRLWGGNCCPSSLAFHAWTAGGGWGAAKTFNTGGGGADARIGVDNNGYVHALFGNGGSDGITYVALKPDGNFGPKVSVPNGGSGAIHHDIAVDRGDGTVHAVFTKDWTHVFYARKGINESGFALFNEAANGSGAVFNTTIAWSPGGQLFLGFNNDRGSYVAGIKSTDNGQSWSGIVPVSDPGGGIASPMVVADPNGGAYAVYNNSRAGAEVNFISVGGGLLPPDQRCAGFADVHKDGPACGAITALSGAGVINGYATNPPTFGPANPVLRAQIAAFLVRGLEWEHLPTGPMSFTDLGTVDGELRDASLRLANACTNPNDPLTCVATGYGDGRFGPNDSVTYAQVIAFIARAMIYDESWQPQSGEHPYEGVPAVHENDVRTYHAYAGLIGGVPVPDSEGGWNQPAPRAWVAVVLYMALENR